MVGIWVHVGFGFAFIVVWMQELGVCIVGLLLHLFILWWFLIITLLVDSGVCCLIVICVFVVFLRFRFGFECSWLVVLLVCVVCFYVCCLFVGGLLIAHVLLVRFGVGWGFGFLWVLTVLCLAVCVVTWVVYSACWFTI